MPLRQASDRQLRGACPGPRRDIEALADRLSEPQPGAAALRFESEHAQGLASQYSILLRKNIIVSVV